MRWREIRRKARRLLHDVLHQPAHYYPNRNPAATPIVCGVRIHEHFVRAGDLAGTSYEYSEHLENIPSIVVLRDEVSPDRTGVFSVAPGEAYEVDVVDAPDDITVRAFVSRMKEADAALFAPPQ